MKERSNLYSDRKSLAAREPESGGWFFWGVERGPFHVSCSAVCNYGGMQADRYHLTPLAPLPGSAIVTRTKLAEESSRKGQKDFVLLMLLSVNASELSPYPD